MPLLLITLAIKILKVCLSQMRSLFFTAALTSVIVNVISVLPVEAIVKEGSIQSDSSFALLTKFCFEAGQQGNEHGFHYSMSFPNTSKLAIIVYYKENGIAVNNWEASWTCQERLAKSRNVYFLNPTKDQRSANSPKKYPEIEEKTDGKSREYPYLSTKGFIYFVSSRKRWYYLTLVNCLPYEKCNPNAPDTFCESHLHVEYSLTLTNGNQGIGKHFSADQYGVMTVYTTFFTTYCFIGLWLAWLVTSLMRKKFYHYTSQLLTLTVIFQWLSLLFNLLNNSSIQDIGQSIPFYRVCGVLFSFISDSCTTLLLYLLAKGWTVVRRKISANGRVKIAIVFTIYFCISIVTLIIYEAKSVNEKEKEIVYLYDSTSGYMLLGLRGYILFWFSQTLITTREKFPERRRFFNILYVGSVLWLFSLPLEVLFAKFILEDYYRSIVITTSNLAVQLIMHAFLMFLWRPQEYSNIFPYNRTTLEMNVVDDNNKNDSNSQNPSLSFVSNMKNKLTSLSTSSKYSKSASKKNIDDGVQLMNVDSTKLKNDKMTNSSVSNLHHPQLRFRGTVIQLRDHLNVLYSVTDELQKTIDDVYDNEGDQAFTPREKKDLLGNNFNSSLYIK